MHCLALSRLHTGEEEGACEIYEQLLSERSQTILVTMPRVRGELHSYCSKQDPAAKPGHALIRIVYGLAEYYSASPSEIAAPNTYAELLAVLRGTYCADEREDAVRTARETLW